MTQTGAIFSAAYRNLNSKKLFWIVLLLSGLSVAAFACVGINDQGFKILVWQIDNDFLNTRVTSPAYFYKQMFVLIGISVWLSWLATILALVSTAGIFPDLITSGSIDLLVSKPISRLRLFITEYMAGLLFVTLQVTVFSLASFLVIGLRGGVWEPGLFVAIPLIVCFFSYLFAVCVLLGVLTRSTVAALLLTLLFWAAIFMVGSAETNVLMFKTMRQHGAGFAEVHVSHQAGDKEENETDKQPSGDKEDGNVKENDSDTLETIHRLLYGVKTVLPKTTDTVALLERTLIDLAELPQQPAQSKDPRQQRMQAAGKEVAETLRSRSVGWVLGTSLGFELLVLACAAWVFCRRDY